MTDKLKLSRYFANLSSAYNAELDDLRTDSEGRNVLKSRLAKKREQLGPILMMMEFSPEMVAVAFHDAFFFKNPLAIESLVTKEANQLPAWSAICEAIQIEPWAQPLVDMTLEVAQGESFLVTTVGLEYLNRSHQTRVTQQPVIEEEVLEESDVDTDNNHSEEYDEDEDSEYDLDQAGADWLAEHGFDRKDIQ
jgi:hypothetical protein